VGVFVAALIGGAAILFSLGASFHRDNLAESHTLFHWGTASAATAGALLVIMFLFWPAYVWVVEYRKRRVAGLRGRPPAPRVPGSGLFRRRRAAGTLQIIEARYGRQETKEEPVTTTVQQLVKDGRLKMTASTNALGIEDPLPNVVKELAVTYRVGTGPVQTRRYTEDFEIDLP
jgi:hypothetical protein